MSREGVKLPDSYDGDTDPPSLARGPGSVRCLSHVNGDDTVVEVETVATRQHRLLVRCSAAVVLRK